jgi:hypothetical protein
LRGWCSGVYEIGGAHEWHKISSGFGVALAALGMCGGTALEFQAL